MHVHFCLSKNTSDKIKIGEIEHHAIWWRIADGTVWISSDGKTLVNYDGQTAPGNKEALAKAFETLHSNGML